MGNKTIAKNGTAPAVEAANENVAVDQDALDVDALAKGVLAREFRPRAASVRRLAEAVLALQDDLKAARKKARKAAKVPGKNKKLAKIPGQKKKKGK